MGRAFAVLAATVALATGWGVVAPAPASAQCAFVVVRHDRAYFLYGSGRPWEIRPGAVLAETLEPGCSDVGGVHAPAPTPVSARRIAGVPPDVAVLVRGRALVAAGYLPRADGFPLDGITVDETKGCRPGAPGSLRGFARVWPAGIMLASGGEPIDVLVDVHTDVTGLSRHGLPYIGDGQRVRVDAVHCGRKIVARRIVANGRIVPATTAEDILGPDWRGGPSETSTSRHGWWAAGAASVTAVVAGGVLVLRRRPGAPHRS